MWRVQGTLVTLLVCKGWRGMRQLWGRDVGCESISWQLSVISQRRWYVQWSGDNVMMGLTQITHIALHPQSHWPMTRQSWSLADQYESGYWYKEMSHWLLVTSSLHLTGHKWHVATCLGVNDDPVPYTLLCHEVLVWHVTCQGVDDGVMMMMTPWYITRDRYMRAGVVSSLWHVMHHPVTWHVWHSAWHGNPLWPEVLRAVTWHQRYTGHNFITSNNPGEVSITSTYWTPWCTTSDNIPVSHLTGYRPPVMIPVLVTLWSLSASCLRLRADHWWPDTRCLWSGCDTGLMISEYQFTGDRWEKGAETPQNVARMFNGKLEITFPSLSVDVVMSVCL